MKKVTIIGAGIAGLTCGIYARLNGFETEIYEMHILPGGECTGWDRGKYHFDGCIHWLMGSKPGSELHDLWKTTGALDDSVRIINHDAFSRYEENGRYVNIYTNADKLKEHLLEISPQDSKEIKKLHKALKSFGSFSMPMSKPMDKMSASDGMKFAAKNITKLGKLNNYNNTPMTEFAEQFKDPMIQKALLSVIPSEYNANALVMTLSSMHEGDSGFPQGGSRAFAKRMEERYTELGGNIFYKRRVDEIIIENGSAAGVRFTDGTEVHSDYVVSCADGYDTLYHMLHNKYTPDVYKNLYEHPKAYYTPTCAIVYMGVGCDIPDEYRSITIRRKQPVSICGKDSDTITLLNYAYDKTMAPEGKTVMAVYYEADFDYWNSLYEDKEKYEQEKKRLEDDATAALQQRYPETKGKVEKTDIVTPVTYVRYCNAWRGSWMSWGNGPDIPRYFPGELQGLDRFIMAGIWTLPPGGLPGASASGRFAAHRLCLKEGIEFKSK